jgi:hypothetical protein
MSSGPDFDSEMLRGYTGDLQTVVELNVGGTLSSVSMRNVLRSGFLHALVTSEMQKTVWHGALFIDRDPELRAILLRFVRRCSTCVKPSSFLTHNQLRTDRLVVSPPWTLEDVASEAAFYQIELEATQNDFEDACGMTRVAELSNRGEMRLITHCSSSLKGHFLATTPQELTFWLGDLETRCTIEPLLNHIFEGQHAGRWDVATIQFWMKPVSRSADRDHSVTAKIVLIAPGKQTVGPWKPHSFALFPLTKGGVFDSNFHPLSHRSWRQLMDKPMVELFDDNRLMHPTNQLVSSVALHARSRNWRTFGYFKVHSTDKEGETQSTLLYGTKARK